MNKGTISWMHRGIEIRFDSEDARFKAVTERGKRISSPSLQAAKSMLDHHLGTKLAGFAALDLYHYGAEKPEKVRVVAAKVIDGRPCFIINQQGRLDIEYQRFSNLLLDNSSNRAALKKFAALEQKTRAKMTELSDALDAARKQLPFIKATDFSTNPRKGQRNEEERSRHQHLPRQPARGASLHQWGLADLHRSAKGEHVPGLPHRGRRDARSRRSDAGAGDQDEGRQRRASPVAKERQAGGALLA